MLQYNQIVLFLITLSLTLDNIIDYTKYYKNEFHRVMKFLSRICGTAVFHMVFVFLLNIFILLYVVDSIIPIAEVKIQHSDSFFYAAPANFGKSLKSQDEALYRTVVQVTGVNKDLCSLNSNTFIDTGRDDFYLLVPRGNCSFETKTVHAQRLGASGIIIYNSLEGIYGGNDYASSTDYDCDNGYGYVKKISYPVYESAMTASIPQSCTKSSKCSSQVCVLTNDTNNFGHKVCCAWDLYMTMGVSSTVTI